MPRRTSVGMAALENRPHILYRFYDRTNVLLYVGITVDLGDRMKQHAGDKDWWSRVDRAATRIEFHNTRTLALEAEREAIKTERPLYNDQHNEWVDDRVGEEVTDTLIDFAGAMLTRILGDTSVAKAAVREAETDLTQLVAGGEVAAGIDPTMWAAVNVAERTRGVLASLEHAVKMLASWLPDDIVCPAYEEARQDLGLDQGPDDLEVTLAAIAHIEDNLSRRLLTGLTDFEAARWRRSAADFLGERRQRGMHPIPERQIVRRAAGYARAVASNNPHLVDTYRCNKDEPSGGRCTRLATRHLIFNNCSRCGGATGNCRGHGSWCDQHFDELLYGDDARAIEEGVAA